MYLVHMITQSRVVMRHGLLEYHSQDATYSLRNYMTGALLYYKHLSQRGKCDITGEELFEGTSKSAEGFGADWVFKKARYEH